MAETIILAYSGGLDTSVLIKWLQQKYDYDVITLTLDVGQHVDLKAVGEKAQTLGVKKHYSLDVRAEFVTDYVIPAIQANALYEGTYPLSTALSRPLIALKMVEIAKKEAAIAVAHGCTGKGNDQVRLEVSINSLNPDLKIIAPIRDWDLTRTDEIQFAKENDIPLSKLSDPYSIDQNLWGRSIECGPLDDPSQEPPEEIFEWTLAPEKCPNSPEYLTLTFDKGVLCEVNGTSSSPVSLIHLVNTLAGNHGVGRIDHIEDRLIGLKSREVYECPAASVIINAHKDLEKLVLTRHEVLFKQQIDNHWTFLAYAGLWLDPLKEALDAFIGKTQERVSGEVKVKLHKGAFRIVGRSSPQSLYAFNIASPISSRIVKQSSAEGFIELWGLQTKIFNILKNR